MPQERYELREQIQSLDKVEPYGASAEARASSETANVLARTTGQFTRLLGAQAEKLAIAMAKREAFNIDPETGVPLMPEGLKVGGLIAADAYQKTLGSRYEANLRQSLKEKIQQAQINNIENEQGFRQEMAIQVGAMVDKIEPDYRELFTDMSSSAIADVSGQMAFAQAKRERAQARAAARSNAAAAAKRAQDQADLDATPDDVVNAIRSSILTSDDYQTMYQVNPTLANQMAELEMRRQMRSYAKNVASLTGSPSYFEPVGEAPELDSNVMGGEDESLTNMIATVEGQWGVGLTGSKVDFKIANAAVDALGDDAVLDEMERENGEQRPTPLQLTADGVIPDVPPEPMMVNGGPFLAGVTLEAQRQAGNHISDFNLKDKNGELSLTAYDAFKRADRWSRLPAADAAVEFAELKGKQVDEAYEQALPGSSLPEFWANVDTRNYDPYAMTMVDMMKQGLYPTSVSNLLSAATSTAGNTDQLYRAVQIWDRWKTGPELSWSWAAKNKEQAGVLDALSIVVDGSAGLSDEELDLQMQTVRANRSEMTWKKYAEDVLEAEKPANPRRFVLNKIETDLMALNNKGAGALGWISRSSSFKAGVPLFDASRIPELSERIAATAMSLPDKSLEEVFKATVDNYIVKTDGVVDTFGKEVQGIFKGDYPKIPTISGDDPMELTRTIASRVVNMAGVVGARPQDVSLLPINSGKEFAIYVDGQDTGYDLDMSKVQRFVAGYQGYQSQTVLPEYGDLVRQRAELMSDLEPYLMKKFMTPEEKDEYDEVLGQIYELNEKSSEISDFSATKMIKELPDLAFDIFTNAGGR